MACMQTSCPSSLLTGPAEAPDTSTSFSLQRRFESNFFRFCQYCSASFPFEIFNSLAISFYARCFMFSFLKSFSRLLYKQGQSLTNSDSFSLLLKGAIINKDMNKQKQFSNDLSNVISNFDYTVSSVISFISNYRQKLATENCRILILIS